jgi:hypothetical protein
LKRFGNVGASSTSKQYGIQSTKTNRTSEENLKRNGKFNYVATVVATLVQRLGICTNRKIQKSVALMQQGDAVAG